MTNNIEAGRRFARIVRSIAGKLLSAADSTHWFEIADEMLDVADEFNISAVINTDYEHWRLVLEINERSMQVYDPLISRGGHIYTFVPPQKTVTMPTRALLKRYGMNAFAGEQERIRILRAQNYELKLPELFRNLGLQKDGYNCGPLVLYAALVANRHTPELNTADFQKLFGDMIFYLCNFKNTKAIRLGTPPDLN